MIVLIDLMDKMKILSFIDFVLLLMTSSLNGFSVPINSCIN